MTCDDEMSREKDKNENFDRISVKHSSSALIEVNIIHWILFFIYNFHAHTHLQVNSFSPKHISKQSCRDVALVLRFVNPASL